MACAPPDDEPWSWQRFLVGRILPWAAVLRGHEAFHASAVAVRGRAAAFVGATGAGKTSLAVQLVARGADFVTDDVLSLSREGDEIRAHAGAAILLSSHLLHLVEEVCTRVIIMDRGHKVADGTFEELAARADLASAGSSLEQIFLRVTGHSIRD